ncbi:MAG TPA: hypothetical protein VIV62_06470 [Chthoniobacterales bacterium]|jgi:hypothetical protein
MLDQATFEYLLPLAYQWCKATEAFVLAHGAPLSPRQLADARRAGVQDCSRIRVLVVDRIPLPENPELAQAARHVRILTEETRCVGFGHALIIRADAWGDRELLVHNLVHIAQCERSGGLEPWVRRYLSNRRTSAQFSLGALEDEARSLAREICTAPASKPSLAGC